MRSAAVVVALSAAVACDAPEPDDDAGADSGPVVVDSGPEDAGPPDAGSGDCVGPPGLYVEGSCDDVATGVRAYRPLHFLWSDGADKERYISLPAGTQIDTSDPDNWIFPSGTVLYKTFLHEGVRLETRVLEKYQDGTGPASWRMRAYAWNAAQDRVTEVQDSDASVRENVLGTQHDIPSQAQCIECHSGSRDTSNSFSAIQLNHDLGGLNLQTLLDEGWLTDPIALADARIPGDATAQAALGYLHANCGNCHRPASGPICAGACRTGFHMWVNVGVTTPEDTATYQTGVAVPHGWGHAELPGEARCRIHPGQPDLSVVHFRMARRVPDTGQMPPIGTEFVHPEGIDIIRTWISGLSADPAPCLPPPGP